MPASSLRFYTTATQNHYIYDSNSNKIFQVDRSIWQSIEEGGSPPPEYTNKGFLDRRGNREFVRLSSGQFDAAVESSIEKLTIEITQECNLACTYCPYNDNFFNFQNRSRSLSISARKALGAVRFFFSHSTGNDHKGISFYGGEPLLRWKTISETTEFARRSAEPSHRLLFGITTNGTSLHDDTISKFLANNRFAVHVSLDGPAHIHDRFRRNPAGEASFATIMSGLDTLRSYYKEDFYRWVHFNAVVTPLSDLDEMREFFRQFEFIRHPGQLRVNYVSLEGAKPELDSLFSDPTTQTRHTRQLRAAREHYLACLVNDREPEILEQALFHRQFRILFSRQVDETEVRRHHPIPVPAICIPLQKKLFVDAHGKFYICEKLNDFTNFGDIERGIAQNRLYRFYESYIEEFAVPYCAACWAKRFCSLCYVSVYASARRRREDRNRKCDQIRQRLTQDLIDYTEVLEKNPQGFDFFLRQTGETINEETT